MIVRSKVQRDLAQLGIRAGDTVMVHAAMRAVGPLLGGPDVVIHALLDLLGASGTIMAYTDWDHGVQHLTDRDAPEAANPELLNELPPFDPRSSRAARSYGVLPEYIRTWPGSQRSGNPDASVAAIGARAAWLCADHPLHYGYGPGSPLAKLVEASGTVLLLGSPLDSVTLLHHSEHMARLPGKRIIRYREPMLIDGAKQWVDFEEFATGDPVIAQAPEGYFATIVENFLAAGHGTCGTVGNGRSYLLPAAPLHHFAVAWMESRWSES